MPSPSTGPLPARASLSWLALGSFAVGTESFMIAAILPDIAADLAISQPVAGQLVSVFALTYAVSSPLVTVLTGRLDRRRLLIAAMTVFVVANGIAAAAPGFAGLMLARVLLAIAAGVYVPNANALAGMLAPPARRGQALAIVTGGLSLAIVFGVPLGAVIGNHLGWRMTFAGVAGLAMIAVSGLIFGLPAAIGATAPVIGLRARLQALADPAVRRPLAVTTLWAMGPFTVYPYLAGYLHDTVGLDGAAVGLALFCWGLAAFAGLAVGGRGTDRLGGTRMVRLTLPLIALTLLTLSLGARLLPAAVAPVVVTAAIIVWGFSAWAFYPAQQARLIGRVGTAAAPVILSVNASCHYFGFSLGAGLGGLVLGAGTTGDLGWVGALCVGLACLIEFTRPAPAGCLQAAS